MLLFNLNNLNHFHTHRLQSNSDWFVHWQCELSANRRAAQQTENKGDLNAGHLCIAGRDHQADDALSAYQNERRRERRSNW